ncbi:MAG: hypothetical protein WD872_13410 [Pirellulaceae bacterium]
MSADSPPFDPYRSPALPEGPYAPTGRSGRPGWLTALCVICIVIGALGLMNGLLGIFGAVFGQQIQSAFTPNSGAQGMPAEMQKLQQQLQDEMNAVQGKFLVPILLFCVLRLVIAGLLLYGGLACLSLKEQGRTILLIACGLGILFEISHAILQSFLNMEVMTAFNAYLEGFLQTLPQDQAGPPPEMLLNVMKGTFVVGLVFQYLIVLVKLGFYLFGALYLQRQKIKALFAVRAEAAGSVPRAL